MLKVSSAASTSFRDGFNAGHDLCTCELEVIGQGRPARNFHYRQPVEGTSQRAIRLPIIRSKPDSGGRDPTEWAMSSCAKTRPRELRALCPQLRRPFRTAK